MKIPFGVVINKADEEENEIKFYCRENNIEILGEIPFKREIAENYSKGNIISDIRPEYKSVFADILKRVKEYGN